MSESKYVSKFPSARNDFEKYLLSDFCPLHDAMGCHKIKVDNRRFADDPEEDETGYKHPVKLNDMETFVVKQVKGPSPSVFTPHFDNYIFIHIDGFEDTFRTSAYELNADNIFVYNGKGRYYNISAVEFSMLEAEAKPVVHVCAKYHEKQPIRIMINALYITRFL